jgi:MtN3 and saliva related transmembrane protein
MRSVGARPPVTRRRSERAVNSVSASSALGLLAAGGGLVVAMAPLLQLRRIVRRRSSADVSAALFAIICINNACWVAYGIAADVPALVLPNSASCVTTLAVLLVTLAFRREGGSR